MFQLKSLLSLALGTSLVRAAAFEPPDNQVLFGAWLDPSADYADTPADFNTRIGQYTPVFQIAQEIPLPAYNWTTGAGGAAPESLIELSGTDAAIFLTVYPATGFGNVTNDDFDNLGLQIQNYISTYNRTVFLRYAPEMQGTWNTYGMQPTAFIASFQTCYTRVKAIASSTIMVWAPNTPQGYPYGQSFTESDTSAADIALLDTSGDGELSSADDALEPYWPGDDYVDWVGLSLYYKGRTSALDTVNEPQRDGYCGLAINGTDPATSRNISNWYTTYCEEKPNVACMLAESGAAYHLNDTSDTYTNADIKQAWISDCITNTTFLDSFPRLKMIMNFEYEKTETANDGDIDLRDYRLANDTDVLDTFKSDIAALGTRFSWANVRSTPTSISSEGQAGPSVVNGTTYTPTGTSSLQAITATTRPRPTTFPSLFGLSSDASRQVVEWIELSVTVAGGMLGVYTVMRNL